MPYASKPQVDSARLAPLLDQPGRRFIKLGLELIEHALGFHEATLRDHLAQPGGGRLA
jgi:hypothetical protein